MIYDLLGCIIALPADDDSAPARPGGRARRRRRGPRTKARDAAPIIFAFHGYPWLIHRLIHRLTYRRTGHGNLHVRGYKEEGTTSTPFDMCVMNDLDRFRLVQDVFDRVPKLGTRAAYAKQAIRDKLIEHKEYIARRGNDMPEITGWKWGQAAATGGRRSTEADNV